MSNAITSAFLNSSSGISDFGSSGTSGAESGNQAMAKVLQDIEQLLTGGQGTSGGSGSGTPGASTGAGNGSSGGVGGLQQLLQDLQALQQGGGSGSGTGVGTGAGTGAGTTPGTGAGSFGSGATQGQGLHDVKLNTKAGGEALHLQEDSNGTLYNGSGNSVGQVNQDGSVSLNSGATKEIQRLETGGKGGLAGLLSGVKPTEGDGGNADFSSSEVTVSAGDLNQKNDF
ncbi:hypothetical protein [Paraburkholderia sp. BCC1886]|uniref:hypothetical protein n=1 Tax=Paraburkholderia sp. BCC1886 TaxID=2562670 RepID=UPI0021B1E998|nr:hypothetical protein [Paraburkholderia sp. BCC1886]